MDKMKKNMPEMPANMKAKMDVVEALKKMAEDMMAEDCEPGEEPGAVLARVDLKKVSPSELPDGNEKPSRLDEMTKEENDMEEHGEESTDNDQELSKEDEDMLMEVLKKRMK